jgi:acyl-coenzyme A synthetase/AMP-(fatty) acid ligase
VALPCTEQLRAKDLGLRLGVARPRLIVADVRDRRELDAALTAGHPDCEVVWVPDEGLSGEHREHGRADDVREERRSADPEGAPALVAGMREADYASVGPTSPPYTDLAESDPCLITFTSGTAGEPKAVVHGVRYLYGQRVQAERWLGAREGDLVWCTAASGWSKSARNVFIAPWLTGAAALLHDARFDPHERLELIEREQVNVLCMAPTEYRVIAKRAGLRALPSLRGMVAAGEALNPEVLHRWREATGLEIRDGYGQTETGQMTGMEIDLPARAGSMGRALPGVELSVLTDRRSRRSAASWSPIPRPYRRSSWAISARARAAARMAAGRSRTTATAVPGTPETGSGRTTTVTCSSKAGQTT